MLHVIQVSQTLQHISESRVRRDVTHQLAFYVDLSRTLAQALQKLFAGAGSHSETPSGCYGKPVHVISR